jgi:hypothetical protein
VENVKKVLALPPGLIAVSFLRINKQLTLKIMIKSIGKLSLVAILAAMVVGMPVRVFAEDAPAASAAPAKAKATRFSGKLTKVDATAKTITVENKSKGDRTFEITSETKITKDGKPATLSDGVVGEPAGGTYTESSDGKMVAKSVRFGAAPKKVASDANPPASSK